jgi:dihydroneopterin aldolase
MQPPIPATPSARVELRDFALKPRIGSYAPGETVPDQHRLDLTLWIAPELVLIAQDGMAHVFDYDPLVQAIEALAQDGPYETQERLMTRIVHACLAHPAIAALEIALRKAPIRPGGGSLGLRLSLDALQLAQLRAGAA